MQCRGSLHHTANALEAALFRSPIGNLSGTKLTFPRAAAKRVRPGGNAQLASIKSNPFEDSKPVGHNRATQPDSEVEILSVSVTSSAKKKAIRLY